MLHLCIGMCAPRVSARAHWMLWVFICYFCDFLALLNSVCVCVCPGEVDDVLDSICVVHNSRDGHRFAPIMVSQELLLNITLN